MQSFIYIVYPVISVATAVFACQLRQRKMVQRVATGKLSPFDSCSKHICFKCELKVVAKLLLSFNILACKVTYDNNVLATSFGCLRRQQQICFCFFTYGLMAIEREMNTHQHCSGAWLSLSFFFIEGDPI